MVRKSQNEIPYDRLLEQERLLLAVTELIAEQMELSGVRKHELAQRLGTSKAYITQALAGGRNLTLRTLADLAWALRRQVHVAMPATEGDDVARTTLRIVAPRYEFEAHEDDDLISVVAKSDPPLVEAIVA